MVDPGPFEDGTSDFAAQISLFKKEQVELFVALVLPPDFSALWRQAAQQGFAKTLKVVTPTKSGGNPSEIEALGALGFNLTTTSPWVPAAPYKSPVLGVTSPQLADGYEAASGKQVTQQLGSSNAVFDAGIQALQMSGNPLDKAALAKTLSNLKCRNDGRCDRFQHRSDAARHRCHAIVRHAVAEGAERQQVEGGAGGRRERGRSEL